MTELGVAKLLFGRRLKSTQNRLAGWLVVDLLSSVFFGLLVAD